MVEKVYNNGIEVGELHDAGWYNVFFGNKHLSVGSANEAFPNWQFQFLKQIHGAEATEISTLISPVPECDGTWTTQKKMALGIYTADCVPVLFADPSKKLISAAHVGWSGLYKGLLGVLNDRLKFNNSFEVYIGPHIRQESYAVGNELYESFRDRYGDEVRKYFMPFEDRYKMNVTGIIEHVLKGYGIDKLVVHTADTFTNGDYNSHRKDNSNKGRQFSFIVMK